LKLGPGLRRGDSSWRCASVAENKCHRVSKRRAVRPPSGIEEKE
jgi:hypothetical protein